MIFLFHMKRGLVKIQQIAVFLWRKLLSGVQIPIQGIIVTNLHSSSEIGDNKTEGGI